MHLPLPKTLETSDPDLITHSEFERREKGATRREDVAAIGAMGLDIAANSKLSSPCPSRSGQGAYRSIIFSEHGRDGDK